MSYPEVDHANKQIQVDADGPFEPVARLFNKVENHANTVSHLVSRLSGLVIAAYHVSHEFAEVIVPTAGWFAARCLLGYSIRLVTTVQPKPIELSFDLTATEKIGTCS